MKLFRKLFQLLQENLPVNCRVYFIYTHKNGFDRFSNGLKANTEISYWCFTALKKSFPSVRFLRYQGEKPSRIAKIRPQDVVIGHIGPTFAEASRYTKKLIAFNPWAGHEDRSREAFNCALADVEMALFEPCASLVLLTSEYNKAVYFEKPANFWHPYFQKLQQTKRVRLVHQPIDLKCFQRIKWDYTTHDFLYIGNDAHMKCVDDTIALVNAAKRQLTIYGFGERRIDNRDQNQVRKLAAQADFFIQPGMWEAQCVSILEAAARGFIPVVSPETGYPYSHPFLLRYKDFDYNFKVLKNLLNTSAEERKTLADSLYQRLVSDVHHNSWTRLTDVLVEEVRHMYFQSIAK
jgi:hypothetical protein